MKVEAAEDCRIGGVGAKPTVLDDEGVDGLLVGFNELGHGELVGRGHVRAGKAERDQAAQRILELFARDRQRHVRPVEPSRRKGRVLHSRGQRLRDRIAEQPDEPGLTGDHGPP